MRWLRSLDRGGGSVTGGIKPRPMWAIRPADARAIWANRADALEQDPGEACDAGGSGSLDRLRGNPTIALEGIQASLASEMLAQ